MQKVLVAGATGYLGKYLVKAFKQQGYYVRALVRSEAKLSQVGSFLEPAISEYVDDVWQGDVTDQASLKGIADGVDIVCSAVGLTRQKGPATFHDVDYMGNLHLLQEAQTSHIQKFMYIHVCKAEKMSNPISDAKSQFVDDLKQSDLNYVVVKPTGYYSDMVPFLDMAKKGTIYELEKGHHQINPIHGEDLADFCVQTAIDENNTECEVGGPTIYHHRDIGALAFKILNKQDHYRNVPVLLLKGLLPLVKPFSAKQHALGKFFVDSMTMDVVAPQYGVDDLETFLKTFNDAKRA